MAKDAALAEAACKYGATRETDNRMIAAGHNLDDELRFERCNAGRQRHARHAISMPKAAAATSWPLTPRVYMPRDGKSDGMLLSESNMDDWLGHGKHLKRLVSTSPPIKAVV